MRLILSIFFLFSTLFSYSENIIVYSKNDARLKAYEDSLRSYHFGLFQVAIASTIVNKKDTAKGMKMMKEIQKMEKTLNPHIKPVAHRSDLQFYYKAGGLTYREITGDDGKRYKIQRQEIIGWMPDLYKKPINIVVYQKHKPVKYFAKKTSSPMPISTPIPIEKSIKKDTIHTEISSTTSYNNRPTDSIMMPDGRKIHRLTFEKRYSKEAYAKTKGN